MPSTWNVYYAVFLSAVLGLGIPAVLLVFSWALRSKSHPEQPHEANNKSILGPRLNVRFFLAANASILLIALALLLIPITVTLVSDNPLISFRSLLAIVSISSTACLGLLYAFRKGDLDWLKTFRPTSGATGLKK